MASLISLVLKSSLLLLLFNNQWSVIKADVSSAFVTPDGGVEAVNGNGRSNKEKNVLSDDSALFFPEKAASCTGSMNHADHPL
jgi:hypothetical protein